MGIISTIGRRSPRVRALVATIYILLSLGAITMLYPFALMVAGSTRSAVDSADSTVFPRYLVNRDALYRKYIESLFNESLDMLRMAYRSDTLSFRLATPPAAPNKAFVDEWARFCRETDLTDSSYTIGELYTPRSLGVMPLRLRAFRRTLSERFAGDLQAMNRTMETDFIGWTAFYHIPDDSLVRRNLAARRPIDDAFRVFKATQPFDTRYYFSPEGCYRMVFLQGRYGKKIEKFNEAHGTAYASWDDIHLDRRLPSGPGRTDAERSDWEAFLRTILSQLWMRADAGAAPAYRSFLLAKYGTVEILNARHGTAYASFDTIQPPDGQTAGPAAVDWSAFLEGWKDPDTGVTHRLPAEHLRVHSTEFMFRDALAAKFGTVEAANAALGTQFRDWMDALPPQQDVHYLAFLGRQGELRREFTVRNFIAVADYLLLRGRAALNTVVYCLLAIFAALVVNPLAAYALSRYKPPSRYKVLLFMMLTMAFPAMVTQIPVFLMLREFSLLNTFWALILPGLAHGYSIFLLKGFFDSLPQELYESAQIDGAGEIRIFIQITMSLSKPILAVIALNAFTVAYSNFMMALLICQDEAMWTLMPWLYQLQQRSCEGVVFASLLVAAIPTLIVFSLCQNVIMRGIVVPVEK